MKQEQLLKVERRLRGDITTVIKYIKACRKKEGSNLFPTSRVDWIKITGLTHNKKHSHFIKKKKNQQTHIIKESTGICHKRKQQSLSPPPQQIPGQLWGHMALLGHWKPLSCLTHGNSFMPTFPNHTSWLQGWETTFSYKSHRYIGLLCFLRKVMGNNVVISITFTLECRKKTTTYGEKELVESTATGNKQ